MEIVKLKIKDLKQYKGNAKQHPKEQIEQIKSSIEQFGMNDPIGVWGEENLIVEGHGRYLALKQLGHKEVDCIRLDHLTADERRAYTLIHNKLTMNSEFDIDILGEELDGIFDVDMSDFGFDLNFEDKFEEPNLDELTANEPEESVSVKLSFNTFKEYSKYENEIKEFAERINAKMSIGK